MIDDRTDLGPARAAPHWLASICDECGRAEEVLARLGGEDLGVDLCAACLRQALEMLEP